MSSQSSILVASLVTVVPSNEYVDVVDGDFVANDGSTIDSGIAAIGDIVARVGN